VRRGREGDRETAEKPQEQGRRKAEKRNGYKKRDGRRRLRPAAGDWRRHRLMYAGSVITGFRNASRSLGELRRAVRESPGPFSRLAARSNGCPDRTAGGSVGPHVLGSLPDYATNEN